MNKLPNKPPISAENLAYFCSQLLDNELPSEDLDRLLQQAADTPAAAQMTQQLHRYALIRQHLQAPQHNPICSHIDLSARVQAALNNTENPVANDDLTLDDSTAKHNRKFFIKPIMQPSRFAARRRQATWLVSGLAAGVMLTISLSWLNQFPASPSRAQLASTSDANLTTRPVSVQELNQDALTQQQLLVEQAQLRAYAQLADADRARFNEYYLMHAGYGGGQNASLTLARVADFNDNNPASYNNGALIVQPVGYPE